MGKFVSEAIAFLKKHWRAAALLALGAALIILSFAPKSVENTEDTQTLDEYRIALEERVATMCSSVSGVGKCRVFITFERGEQTTYKGSAIAEVKPPRVLGVTVVCRGAESDRVRRDITEMLAALFDIGTNRVAVLKLNS